LHDAIFSVFLFVAVLVFPLFSTQYFRVLSLVFLHTPYDAIIIVCLLLIRILYIRPFGVYLGPFSSASNNLHTKRRPDFMRQRR
jgi:hypothetical protein